jgi:hypothetical protein
MLNLVTARARTRGKSPVEFQYQAIGRLIPRKVTDKDGNAIIVNDKNEQVKYSFDKDGKLNPVEGISQNDKGELVVSGNLRLVEVDDVEVKGVTSEFQDALDLFGSLTEEERSGRSPLQMAIDSCLDGFNYASRKKASPVSEQVQEDELAPIVQALISNKILSDEDSTVWRRSVTTAAKLMEMDRVSYAKITPAFKKLSADVQKSFADAA